MIKTEELMRIVFREGIILEHKAMTAAVNGVYYCAEGLHAIFMNESITENPCLYRSVLAEELGHHFTSVGVTAPLRCMSYRERVDHDRCELIALRWAADFMMPTDSLLAIMAELRHVTLAALAKAFEIEEYLVMRKLEAMAAEKHTWSLQGGRRLVLTNLPDVYLYDAM